MNRAGADPGRGGTATRAEAEESAGDDSEAGPRHNRHFRRLGDVIRTGGVACSTAAGPETALTRNSTFTDLVVARRGKVSEHARVHAQSGARVILDSRSDAMERLAPVIMAGGHMPARWEWKPAPSFPRATGRQVGAVLAGRRCSARGARGNGTSPSPAMGSMPRAKRYRLGRCFLPWMRLYGFA
jgi:hypothetical protein